MMLQALASVKGEGLTDQDLHRRIVIAQLGVELGMTVIVSTAAEGNNDRAEPFRPVYSADRLYASCAWWLAVMRRGVKIVAFYIVTEPFRETPCQAVLVMAHTLVNEKLQAHLVMK
jgi:hypothetical protein